MTFLTGATGLVGSEIAYRLLLKGEIITALKRAHSDTSLIEKHFQARQAPVELLNNLKWVTGNLLDVSFLEEALQNTSTIIHAAALVSFDEADRIAMNKVNIEGTANLVNAALAGGIEKFGYVSSTAAIGRGKPGNKEPVTEETKWFSGKRTSNYAISKHYAEREVWRGMEEGLDIYLVNPGIVVGPGNWKSSSSKTFSSLYDGLKFYTSGSNGFVDVRDVAEVLITIMEKDLSSRRYLLIGENMTFKHYFELLSTALHKKPPHIKANKLMAQFARLSERIKSVFTGSKPLITGETIQSAFTQTRYDSRRILKDLPEFTFTPIQEAVAFTAHRFLNEKAHFPSGSKETDSL